MEINPNIKYDRLPHFVREHLMFTSTNNVRGSVAVLVLFLYDSPLLLSFLILMKIEFLWLFMPFIAFLHIWLVRMLIKSPYTTQFEMVLFLGVSGLIGALTFFIMLQAVPYFSLGINSKLYYLISNVIVFIVAYTIARYQIAKYRNIKKYNANQEKKKPSKYLGVIGATSGLGYIIGMLVSKTTIAIYYFVIGVNLCLTLLLFYVGVKFVHRYIFMKTNINYVRFAKPTKTERKELIKKGVEYK